MSKRKGKHSLIYVLWYKMACDLYVKIKDGWYNPKFRYHEETILPVLEKAAGIVFYEGQPYSKLGHRIVACVIVLAPKFGLTLPCATGWIADLVDKANPGSVPKFKQKRMSNNKRNKSYKTTIVGNSKVASFYKSYEWRKLRYYILIKYGRVCMCCGDKTPPFHVDHIKPLRKYWSLRLEPNNMQVLCDICNHGKGNWDETDFRPERTIPVAETTEQDPMYDGLSIEERNRLAAIEEQLKLH